MVTRLAPSRGGHQRPYMVAAWVRDAMAGGRVAYAEELYQEFKRYVEHIPLAKEKRAAAILAGRVRSRRRVVSYGGFRDYLYTLRQKGLIQYTGFTAPALEPYLEDQKFFVAINPGDPAWNDPLH